jgi:hypothetical protein
MKVTIPGTPGSDVNKPQIGPLLMDIRHQRHLILAGIMGLDPDLPAEHVSSTAKDMFINNLVSISPILLLLMLKKLDHLKKNV